MGFASFEWLRRKTKDLLNTQKNEIGTMITNQSNDLKTAIPNNVVTSTNGKFTDMHNDIRSYFGWVPRGLMHIVCDAYPGALVLTNSVPGQVYSSSDILYDNSNIGNNPITPFRLRVEYNLGGWGDPTYGPSAGNQPNSAGGHISVRNRLYVYCDEVCRIKMEMPFFHPFYADLNPQYFNIMLDPIDVVTRGMVPDNQGAWVSTWTGDKVINYPLIARQHLKIQLIRDVRNDDVPANQFINYAFPSVHALCELGG